VLIVLIENSSKHFGTKTNKPNKTIKHKKNHRGGAPTGMNKENYNNLSSKQQATPKEQHSKQKTTSEPIEEPPKQNRERDKGQLKPTPTNPPHRPPINNTPVFPHPPHYISP
jgi:hypothetical protein